MNPKATLDGLRIMFRNVRYCSSYIKRPQHRRTQNIVHNEYQKIYSDGAYNKHQKQRLAVVNGLFTYLDKADLDVQFIREHHRSICRLLGDSAGRVLEVGSGDGRIIYPIATALPKLDFFGIEYSETGPARAVENLRLNISSLE
jgi:tRNA G46 methylase TrmB